LTKLDRAIEPASTRLYQELARLEAEGRAGVLCTIVRSTGSTPRHTGSKMLVYPDGSFIGTVGGGEFENRVIAAALESLQSGSAQLIEYAMADPERGDPGVCGGQLEVFVEPLLPRATVVVVGCGHVGRAVAALAGWLGFRVVVSDDRAELCTPEQVPGAEAYFPCALADLPGQMQAENYAIRNNTFVVLTTRSVDIDVPGLPALLDTPASYIGVIGSRRRWQTTRQQLGKRGIADEKLNQVRSPIGLDLHAETPEEIAVSILAEIIQVWRNK
jgi:xanthine dehydrogenase accessory factor